MTPHQANSAELRLIQTRAEIPGGSQQDRQDDFDKTMRHQGLYLVRAELDRTAYVPRARQGFFHRLQQAVNLLLGRGTVWIERRRSPRS